MLDIVGLAPPKGAHAHKVYLDKHRGPASTDPDKAHPAGPAEPSRTKRSRESDLSGKKETRETDGLYFRRYEYDAARAVKAATGRASRVFQTRPRRDLSLSLSRSLSLTHSFTLALTLSLSDAHTNTQSPVATGRASSVFQTRRASA